MKRSVEVMEGVEVRVDGKKVTVTGELGKVERVFEHPFVTLSKKEGRIEIESKEERRKVRAIVGTWEALLKNMMLGVKYGWKAELKLVYSHFPARIKKSGNLVIIENFMGEKKPRVAECVEGVDVKINGSDVVLFGVDKEKVGNMALRIEQATGVKGYDRRVFQDGCYIVRHPYLAKGEKDGG